MDNLKIAYIGGGSRGWAWGFMKDLALDGELCGEVRLYDIDMAAAENNRVIGEKISAHPKAASRWRYSVAQTLREALDGADFVVISILPGTFKEMRSDVHAPERFGIYQSVGDTTGPGGIIRALRAIPMFTEIAEAIRDTCPDAWVINYTNPMARCIRALYEAFPRIKAFGCCHEVFSTQKLLCGMLGIDPGRRSEIAISVFG
jgi:alpha-galactosidase